MPPCKVRSRVGLPVLFPLVFFLFQMLFPSALIADEETDAKPPEPWYGKTDYEWSGRIRTRATASWYDDDSFFKIVDTDTDTNMDANAEVRLKGKLYFDDWGYFEAHYEAIVAGGETRDEIEEIKTLFPALSGEDLLLGGVIDDDRRLMDLTKVVSETDSRIVYHRIDRLSLTLLPEWGTVRVGRQVITWGNGFLFNPMDLFNPFAPTDIERDYKVGDDMITVQLPSQSIGDFEFLYVPRRDPNDHEVEWDSQSSLAAKFHFAKGTTEFDIMAARHYRDHVLGAGAAGYFADAAWRADATWTFLRDGYERDGYLSLTANMDYSWVWRRKNWYGFVEFFYNGLGENDPAKAFANPDVIERLDRGELFTLGRVYASGTVQIELHPLFNVFATLVNNLNDPSGIFQPRASWNVRENAEVTFGGNIAYGGHGSEFGGFAIPGTQLLTSVPNSAFVWLTFYF